MAVVTAQLTVTDPEAAIGSYQYVRIYRSTTGVPGSYVELTTPATRLHLLKDAQVYYWVDPVGALTYYYQAKLYNPVGALLGPEVTMAVEAGANPLAIVSVGELKEHYLFGVDLTDDLKRAYPDSMFEEFVRAAVDQVSIDLDIPLLPEDVVGEKHDFNREDYSKYIFIQLKKAPLLSVQEVRMVMPGEQTILTCDASWLHPQLDSGQLQVVPGAGIAGSILLGASGAYMPLIYGSCKHVPDIFRVDYLAGLWPTPRQVKDLVAMLACFGPLNTAGDLIAGAGIASKSLGIDGLSQSIGTTSSATNSGYGARLLIYAKKIKELLPKLRRYYKGVRMVVV
ncbi:MAG: hypothetical protein WC789_07075 [Lentisphaeria bacterium]